MKKLKSKKGTSLIEVLLAIVIFSIVTMPLLSVFVQSMNVDRKANEVFNANYISQDYLERLDALTYTEALSDLPDGVTVENGYNFTATITPYGNLSSKFDHEQCSYIHLIMYEDGSALCVMPDGKWHIFESVPSSFSLTISYDSYSFTGGYTTLTGQLDNDYCVIIVNAMNKPDATTSSITLGTNCQAVLYTTKVNSGDITISGGDYSIYEDLIEGNTSLIFVSTALYDPSEENVIAKSDGYINIKNW